MTFDSIRELFRQNNPSIDSRLADEFDRHLKNVMLDLSGKHLQTLSDTVANTHIIKAKYALFEICFVKIIDFLANADPAIA